MLSASQKAKQPNNTCSNCESGPVVVLTAFLIASMLVEIMGDLLTRKKGGGRGHLFCHNKAFERGKGEFVKVSRMECPSNQVVI